MGAAIIINSGHGRCCQKCPQAVSIFWIFSKLVKNLYSYIYIFKPLTLPYQAPYQAIQPFQSPCQSNFGTTAAYQSYQPLYNYGYPSYY